MPDAIDVATGGLFTSSGIHVGSRGLIGDPSQESVATIIRRHVAGILQGQSAASDRVQASSARPVSMKAGEHQIRVYSGDETANRISQSYLLHAHSLELLVEVYGLGPDPEMLLGQLEAIARVAIVLVLNEPTLGACVDQVSYVGREWGKDEDGRMNGEALRLRFTVEYRTEYGLIVPDEFLQLGLGYDVDGDGVVDPAQGSGLDLEEVHPIQT